MFFNDKPLGCDSRIMVDDGLMTFQLIVWFAVAGVVLLFCTKCVVERSRMMAQQSLYARWEQLIQDHSSCTVLVWSEEDQLWYTFGEDAEAVGHALSWNVATFLTGTTSTSWLAFPDSDREKVWKGIGYKGLWSK